MKKKIRYVGVGASGPGAGKTTFSLIFTELNNYKLVNFGDALKKEVTSLFSGQKLYDVFHPHFTVEDYIRSYCTSIDQGIRLKYVWDNWYGRNIDLQDELIKNFWFREWLQWWGTEVRRKQDPDYWTDQMPWESEENLAAGDLRFDGNKPGSETQAIKNHGGISVYLHGENTYTGSHSSEMLRPSKCDIQVDWSKTDSKKSWKSFCQVCEFTHNPRPSYKKFLSSLEKHTSK